MVPNEFHTYALSDFTMDGYKINAKSTIRMVTLEIYDDSYKLDFTDMTRTITLHDTSLVKTREAIYESFVSKIHNMMGVAKEALEASVNGEHYNVYKRIAGDNEPSYAMVCAQAFDHRERRAFTVSSCHGNVIFSNKNANDHIKFLDQFLFVMGTILDLVNANHNKCINVEG